MKKLFLLLVIALAPLIIKAQPTSGNPVLIDRAMSVWARNIANANEVFIFGESAANIDSIEVFRDSLNNYVIRFYTDTLYDYSGNGIIVIGPSTGNFINDEYDLIIGNDTTGLMRIGNLEFGTADDRVVGASLTTGGTVYFVVQNQPDGIAEFIFTEASGSIRFAMPRSGLGYGTYNPRSMIIAGPSVMKDSMMIGTYWGFNRLFMDTGNNGSDLGVQNNAQIGDSLFVNTVIVLGGDQFDTQSDSIIFKPGSITLTNGASITNTETDTVYITETVIKVVGDFVVTGHVSESEHDSGQTTITTPGTQTITTGGTFERMNGGAIAYTGDHLHEFTESDGRLTYIGTEPLDGTAHWNISLESGETAQVVQLRIALSGTTIALSNQSVTFSNQNSNASFGSTRLIDMVQNDYVELWITSDTSSDEIIINNATLNVTKH